MQTRYAAGSDALPHLRKYERRFLKWFVFSLENYVGIIYYIRDQTWFIATVCKCFFVFLNQFFYVFCIGYIGRWYTKGFPPRLYIENASALKPKCAGEN